MGQAASKVSKRVGKSAESLVKKASEHKTAPPPPPPPPMQRHGGNESTPANPGGFLRGDGLASEDIRDVGQEIFLQSQQKDAPQEMPSDLIRFIQDIGPAKRDVDKEKTSSRLLDSENFNELEKTEAERTSPRQRINMPLMGEDYDHSVARNTNFSSRAEEVEKDFGITNLQFFDLVRQKRDSSVDDDSKLVGKFYGRIKGDDEWSEEENENHRKLLRDALQTVKIPVLRIDQNGNILGLHPDRVPGSEVKSVQPISPKKARLVMDDLLERAKEPAITIKRIRRKTEKV